MTSLLKTIHTKFPEQSAWNVLWMLSYQCGIEEVQNALDEMKVLFHESGLTQRAGGLGAGRRQSCTAQAEMTVREATKRQSPSR